jgi:hypothetical protein
LLTAPDLPGHADLAALHETLIDLDARKAPLDKITFKKGLGLLHSDRLLAFPEAHAKHYKRLDELDYWFRSLRKPFKVDAKYKALTPEQKAKRGATRARNKAFQADFLRRGHPMPLPEKLEGWEALREKTRAAQKAKRDAAKANQ